MEYPVNPPNLFYCVPESCPGPYTIPKEFTIDDNNYNSSSSSGCSSDTNLMTKIFIGFYLTDENTY